MSGNPYRDQMVDEIKAEPAMTDAEAAALLLGGEKVQSVSWTEDPYRKTSQYQVTGSTGTVYTVTEKPDSMKGGWYWHCTCQGWLPAYRNGNRCKHIKSVMSTQVSGKF